MHNLYTDSVISNACLSFSFNGGYSSSSCSCCCCSCNCCSSISINTVTSSRLVPINPSPLYGFRQSILIQRPPSRRRMILANGAPSPIGDLGPTRNTYRNLSCIRDVGSDWIRYHAMKSKRKGIEFRGYGRMSVLKESYIFHKVGACDGAEAIISLLTEELGEERRKKKVSSSKKGTFRENVVDEGFKDFVKCKDSRLRKGRASGSSYCLCSDLGNSEVRVAKHKECTEMGSEKEFRKRVGGVAIKEQVKEKLEDQRIEKNHCLESGRRDHVEVGTSGRLDLRKNSRKKLREESVSVLSQSRLSDAHVSDSHKGSGIKKQYNYRVGGSISEVNSSDSSYKNEHVTGSTGFVDGKSTGYLSKASGSKASVVSAGEFCTSCGQVTSGNEQQSKLVQCNNAGFISNAETKVASRQKESSSLIQESANEVHEQHKQEHLVASYQVNLRKSEDYNERADAAESYEENTNISRRRIKLSETQNTGMRLKSTVRQESDTRITRQEETSSLNRISLKEVNEKSHQEHHVATSQTELMRKNQKRIEVVDTSNSNVQDTSRVQQKKENMVSLSSQLAKGERFQTGMQAKSRKQSRQSSKDLSGSLQVHFDETMIADSSSASEERLHYEQSYLRERVKETHERVKETIKQTELRYEIQKPLRESNVTSTSQIRIEEIAEEEDKRNLPSGISPRLNPPQSIEVTHEHDEIGKQAELRYEVQMPEPSFVKETSRHPHVTSTSQVRIEELGEEEDERNLPCGPSQKLDPHPQSIEVKEMHENVMKTVEQTALRYEVQTPLRTLSSVKETSGPPCVTSTSQVKIEEIGEEEDARNLPSGESGPSQWLDPPPQSIELHPVYVESTSTFPDLDSHRNSGGESSIFIDLQSTDLSPHDDLLGSAESSIYVDFENSKLRKECSSHLSGSFTSNEPNDEMLTLEQQPPEREQSENSETPPNGIVRRSGRVLWNVLANIVQLQWGLLAEARNNSTVKTSGQSSLSDSVGSKAHDLVDAQGGNMETGTSRTPLEPSSTYQPLLVRTPTQSPIEGAKVLSSSFGGLSGETNIELNADKMNWSQSDVMQLRRSHRRSDAMYELQESGNEAAGSVTVDQSKGDSDPSLTVVSGSEENEAELRQGKLLRSNQVMKERFDEWEEAYRLESEQRKIDQTFMREALEEAKKAADIWEVPVGAVLVQDGKIIARGHNLVEELRDSTAHAEITCIRDASSILKTWRLSETTLYVTLEPCAMCAGAILQARIGTLVYGAPNKLLGADGSWVRLFPGSVDREGGSESTAKAEGPVHPFHPKMKIRRGILEAECGDVMHQSFKLRRKKGNKSDEQLSNRKLHNPSKLLHKMHHRFNFLFCL